MAFTLHYSKLSSNKMRHFPRRHVSSLSHSHVIRAIREETHVAVGAAVNHSSRRTKPNTTIDATDLSLALTSAPDLRAGAHHHCAAATRGLAANVYVGTCLVNMYAKFDSLSAARQVFEEMTVKCVVTWTAMIAAIARGGGGSELETCFGLSNRMRLSGSTPNSYTYATLLCVSSAAGAISQGKTVHSQAIRTGLDRHVHVSNTLISMYSKCGALEDAALAFEELDEKDTVSWNSMIAGFARHGLATRALETFEEMKRRRRRDCSGGPDSITFLHVLSSCRHAGMVERARDYFGSMAEEHGVEPGLDHYSCLVDILGRAGHLAEARQVIETMPFEPNAYVWSSMMSACRAHGDVRLGTEVAERRLAVEPGCTATYVQLANLCAGAGRWDRAAAARRSMRDGGLKIGSGFSWVEVRSVVHKFKAGDRSNERMVGIVLVLDGLVDHMRTLGFDSEMHEFLQCYG